MRSLVALPAVAPLVLACSGGLSGAYLYAPGYGFEFKGDTVYSLAGADIGRGTYTIDGSSVRVCFGFMCTEMRIDDDCLVQPDGARYCKG